MLRGYWRYIFAIGLILAGHHPNAVAQPKKETAQERTADALENIAKTYDEQTKRSERSPETEPCEQGQDNRNSDLCAQWKAADSAQIAAWLSGASFAAVLIALWFAFRSNWIARDTAKRQLRAYVSVEPKGIYERDSDGNIIVPIAIKNAGQTPAYQVTVFSWFSLSDDPLSFDPSAPNRERPPNYDPTEITIGPGETHHVYTRMPFSPTKPEMLAIASKETAIIHYGVVTYVDAFKAGRNTEFAHYHRGEELSGAEAKRCRLGNHAD
jgi:hypothetical protein